MCVCACVCPCVRMCYCYCEQNLLAQSFPINLRSETFLGFKFKHFLKFNNKSTEQQHNVMLTLYMRDLDNTTFSVSIHSNIKFILSIFFKGIPKQIICECTYLHLMVVHKLTYWIRKQAFKDANL